MLTELGKFAYTYYLEDTVEQIIKKVSKLFAGDEKSGEDYKILFKILQNLKRCNFTKNLIFRVLGRDSDVPIE